MVYAVNSSAISASQMIVKAEMSFPEIKLARIAVALSVSAFGRPFVRNDSAPLFMIGPAKDRLVNAGIVVKRLSNDNDAALLPRKKENVRLTVVTTTRVISSEIGSSCNRRS